MRLGKVAAMLAVGAMVMLMPIKSEASHCIYGDNCANADECIGTGNCTYEGVCTYSDCTEQNLHLHDNKMYIPANLTECPISDCTETGQHVHHDAIYGPHHNSQVSQNSTDSQAGSDSRSTQTYNGHHSRGHHGGRHH